MAVVHKYDPLQFELETVKAVIGMREGLYMIDTYVSVLSTGRTCASNLQARYSILFIAL